MTELNDVLYFITTPRMRNVDLVQQLNQSKNAYEFKQLLYH